MTASHPRIRVAAIILEDNAILLVRHQKGDATYWMLPGGGVDAGETLHEALQREMREELCVEVAPGPLVLVNDSIAPDHRRHVVNLHFLAEITAGIPACGCDERVVEVAWIPVPDLDSLKFRPDFTRVLGAAIASSFAEGVHYAGNIWRD